jgi:hypothetical protein
VNLFSSQTIDATLAAVGNRTAQAGGGTTVASWILSSEFGVLVGIIIGVSGLVMQWYYNRKRDKREQAEFEKRMGEKP